MQAIVDAFTEDDRDHGQGQHRRPRHVPGPDQLLPPGHAGRRLHLVLRATGCGSSRRRAWPRHRRRLGQGRRRTSPTRSRSPRPATTASSTSSRSTTTRGSSIYRKSVFAGEGLHVPDDARRVQDPRREDEDRRPRPDRPWRQGRLARAWALRHHQPAGERLRVPCRPDGRAPRSGPTRRSSRSSRSGRSCCRSTRRAPPVGRGRTPPQASSRRRPGCTPARRFGSSSSRPPAQADLADLDFFPWPNHGTAVRRREGARRADRRLHADRQVADPGRRTRTPPRRSSSSSAKGPTPDHLRRGQPGQHRRRQRRRHERLHAAPEEGRPSHRRRPADHPVPRPGHRPDFAGKQGMQAFLQRLPPDPDQDLDAYLKKIQDFWDSLGPV